MQAEQADPKGLIRYTTENAMKRHWGRKEIIGHMMRPRIIIYAAVLVVLKCSRRPKKAIRKYSLSVWTMY